MAKQIIVNSENKSLDVTIEARNVIDLTVSRAVGPGVSQINAGQNISVTGVSNVTISVTGTVPTANTVVSADQPNITSVGILTGLTSSGNITAPYFIGNVQGNIIGNLVVPGNEGDILFNQGGNAGASPDLNYDDINNVLNIAGSANVNVLNATNIGTSLVPITNVSLDLGSADYRWKDLYLSGNTIYLGNSTISADNGNIVLSGNITVTEIFGDGGGLSNIAGANITGEVSYAAVANAVAGANVSGEVAYAAVANSVAGANVSGEVSFAAVANSVAGGNVSGQVANALVAGTVYTNAQPNITSVGTLINLDVSGNASVGNLRSDNLQYANGAPYVFTTNAAGSNTQVQFNDDTQFAGSSNFTFNKTSNTLTVTNIVADGAGLTNLTGANVTGTVANASHATQADNANVANSVAGANVSGAVNLATFATTANSVAGANVSGTVANATYATISGTSYSVSGSNVVGSVANATHALNADVANSVSGSNVSGQVANALVSGTVYNNNQPNITSVGTLANLLVTGDIQGYANISGDYILGNGAFLTGVGDFSAAKGYHGSFYSNVSQTIANTTTAYPITLNNTDPDSYGISIANNSQITTTYPGTYNLQYSIQFTNTDNNIHNATVWLRKNGVDVPDTSSVFAVLARHGSINGQIIGSVNYIVDTITDDYFELIWQAESTSVSLEYIAPGTTPTSPASPSIIVTMVQVTNVQAAALGGALTANLIGNSYGLTGVSFVNVTGNIQGNVIIGNGSGLTQLVGANVIGTVSSAEQANIANTANTVAGANVTGSVPNATLAAAATVAYSVDAANIVGTVANATHAVVADSANSVAGANVSGAVAFATTANSVAGANVSGEVAFAAVANSVAGANVSGEVAFAAVANSVAGANVSGEVSYAAIANSVAVANVSGIGNIATINLNGNSSQVLAGDGTWVEQTGGVQNPLTANLNTDGYSITSTNTNSTITITDKPTGNTDQATLMRFVVESGDNPAAWGGGFRFNGAPLILESWTNPGAFDPTSPIIQTLNDANLLIYAGNQALELRSDGAFINGSPLGGGGGGTPGGSDTQVQFNNAGTFGGMANVTYDVYSEILNLGEVANIKMQGGTENTFLRNNGYGDLDFAPITNTLTVATRSTAVNIGITNYTMNVEGRTGNIVVNVN